MNWKEQFEEVIRPFGLRGELMMVPHIQNHSKIWAMERKEEEIIDFIETLLAEHRKDLADKVKAMLKKEVMLTSTNVLGWQIKGHNEALRDVLKLLQEEN